MFSIQTKIKRSEKISKWRTEGNLVSLNPEIIKIKNYFKETLKNQLKYAQ